MAIFNEVRELRPKKRRTILLEDLEHFCQLLCLKHTYIVILALLAKCSFVFAKCILIQNETYLILPFISEVGFQVYYGFDSDTCRRFRRKI